MHHNPVSEAKTPAAAGGRSTLERWYARQGTDTQLEGLDSCSPVSGASPVSRSAYQSADLEQRPCDWEQDTLGDARGARLAGPAPMWKRVLRYLMAQH